jgi:hypothetical protein
MQMSGQFFLSFLVAVCGATFDLVSFNFALFLQAKNQRDNRILFARSAYSAPPPPIPLHEHTNRSD